jgi:hypothetical protein
MLPTTPPPIRACFTDDELAARERARPRWRPALPCPAAAVGWLAVALCEVEAGARPRHQLERACHPTLWEVLAPHLRGGAAPMVTSRSLRRVLAQEPTPGIVDGVAVVQRGRLVEPIAMRLDAAAGHWELVELQYLPAAGRAAPATGRHLLAGRAWASAVLPRAAPPLPLRWWPLASCGGQAPSRRGGGGLAGRVNTLRRIQWFRALGVDSFDGTGFARFTRARLPMATAALAAPAQGTLL